MTRQLACILALAGASIMGCQEPKSTPVVRGGVLPDSAEQLMLGVHFFLTDAGVSHGEVKSDTAFMYDQSTRAELKRVTATFFTSTGEKNGTLTAREGTYHVRVGSMEARGNVVVVTTDGRKLETPQLKYDPTRNEISSDSAFTSTESDRVIKGIGFISDPQMNKVRVLRAAKASGQSVRIPRK